MVTDAIRIVCRRRTAVVIAYIRACFNLESSDERSPHLLNMTVDSPFSAALTVCACLEQDNIQLHYPKDNGEGLVRERGEELIIRAVTESEG
ncbi:hypothetical protein JFU04_16210 [Pseudomonas sp. TH21]|uniref:hypothetical protein n=1 Tax=Pseudomonas sp. TH21 TaxID=2796387 RepID=UPI0013C3F8A6|nr:hypothetical protein [Pseudomonas sp. TH21]MBK5477634.1 hypothetical protein [Pseudomonas sp. TH21]QTV16724.1 hypothetical protein J9321_26905 [Pseudomonas fluorescens]